MEDTKKSWGVRAGITALWVLTVLEALGMGVAGLAKFGSSTWPDMFAGWGYPAGFVYVVGSVEVAGALGVLVPRFATYAAALLAIVMVCALATVIVHDDPLGVTGPMVHLTALAIIGASRRGRRWKPGGRTAS